MKSWTEVYQACYYIWFGSISAIHSFNNILSNKVIFYVNFLYKSYLRCSSKHLLFILCKRLYLTSVSVFFILHLCNGKSFLHCSSIFCAENQGSGSNINWLAPVRLHVICFKNRTGIIDREFLKFTPQSIITGKLKKMTFTLPSSVAS